MENRKFIVECEIPERWVNDFCAMLEDMWYFGAMGQSRVVGMYVDGDGDFSPSFTIKTDYNSALATCKEKYKPFNIYDAG